MSLVGLSEVEQLRDANLRMAAGIEEMAARIERLEADIEILSKTLNGIANREDFAHAVLERGRAALAGKEG